jgi:hypothetical protein
MIIISLSCLLFATAAFACGRSASTVSGTGQTTPTSGLPGSPVAIAFWQNQFPDDKVILAVSGDINADNRPDTIIVYQLPGGNCQFQAVLDLASGYSLTGTLPAPLENQKVSFIDFDSKPPTEIFVSGENGNNVGMGIFRLENNEFVNVFGDDYDACCGV